MTHAAKRPPTPTCSVPLLPGLSVAADAITPAQEAALIARIEAADPAAFQFQQWEGKKLTRSFGWTYDFQTGRFAPGEHPAWLRPARALAACFAGLDPAAFTGPDFEEAVNGPTERRAPGLMPDPMPLEAPVPRVTLSLATITPARALMIAVRGIEKRAIIETAIKEGRSSRPIDLALAGTELPVDIYWAP